MIRRLLAVWIGAATLGLAARAADDLVLARYNRVEIAPTQTSIYIGSVSMTMPTFERRNGIYEADYTAKVSPLWFYTEHGLLTIDVSDDSLRRLAQGETIEFNGHGVNSDGTVRHVEGRAVPSDATSGKIKVRVYVSRRIQLIFNTTYRFVEK